MNHACAVLWDLDGTLVDSEPLHRRTLAEVLKEAGCHVPADIGALVTGRSIDGVHAILRERFGLSLPLDAFAGRRAELYVALRHTVLPRPGAIAIIASLAARGVPQAIVSNSGRGIVDANIEAAALDRFDLVTVSRNDVTNAKPHPEPYLHAASMLGVAPSGCVVVEDSPTGASAGAAAGCQVVVWVEPHSTLTFDRGMQRVDDAETLSSALFRALGQEA